MSETGHDHPLPAGSVVVGYDQHPVAGRALDWAADQADRESRPLVIVHATGTLGSVADTARGLADPATVPSLTDLERQAHAVLARALSRVGRRHPSVSLTPLVAPGEPGPELAALSRGAQLVVVGSRGHGLTRAVPTGQIGAWLASRTACPVVVVPDFNPVIVRQGVLVGLPIGEDAGAVLDFALRHASLRGLPLTVLHATRDGKAVAEEDRRRWVAEALGGHAERFPDVPVGIEVVHGRPARTLLRMAERMNLLVVGRHASTGLHELPVGHVRGGIVDRAPCPTAVVPIRVAHRVRSGPVT